MVRYFTHSRKRMCLIKKEPGDTEEVNTQEPCGSQIISNGNQTPEPNTDIKPVVNGQCSLPPESVKVEVRQELPKETEVTLKQEELSNDADWSPQLGNIQKEKLNKPRELSPNLKMEVKVEPYFIQGTSYESKTEHSTDNELEAEVRLAQLECLQTLTQGVTRQPDVRINEEEIGGDEQNDFHVVEEDMQNPMTCSPIPVADGEGQSSPNRDLFICASCSMGFTQKRRLRQHIKTHEEKLVSVKNTKKKRYSCGSCAKTFMAPSALKKHQLTHTGERPFVCRVCSKGFSQKFSLTRHLQIHTDEKSFLCRVCSKAFRHKNSLTLHLRTHTGEKPFVCLVCSKAFSDKSNLTRHIRIHSDKMPYVCVQLFDRG